MPGAGSTPSILAFRRKGLWISEGQPGLQGEFQDSLGHTVRSCSKTNKKLLEQLLVGYKMGVKIYPLSLEDCRTLTADVSAVLRITEVERNGDDTNDASRREGGPFCCEGTAQKHICRKNRLHPHLF